MATIKKRNWKFLYIFSCQKIYFGTYLSFFLLSKSKHQSRVKNIKMVNLKVFWWESTFTELRRKLLTLVIVLVIWLNTNIFRKKEKWFLNPKSFISVPFTVFDIPGKNGYLQSSLIARIDWNGRRPIWLKITICSFVLEKWLKWSCSNWTWTEIFNFRKWKCETNIE